MFARLFPLLFGLTVVVALRCNKFYRRDYTYVEQFDAFYKLHWDPAGQSWSSAFLSCDEEGATLFYPKTREEWVVAKTLISTMKVKPNVTDIFVGIHDEFGLGEFMTVDGLSTPSPLPDKEQEADGQGTCVAMEIDTGEFKLESCEALTVKPFACKKVEEAVPSCPTVDRGHTDSSIVIKAFSYCGTDYVYNKDIRKCLKISKRQKTWTDALQTCFMEGGTLALITDSDKSSALYNMLYDERLQQQRQTDSHEWFFTGFRRLFPNGDFYTVKGHQYDNSYYKTWWSTFVSNNDKQFDCGIIMAYREGLITTSTRDCMKPARFVCEMEVKP